MIKSGLVSITFRSLSVEQVIELVKKAGLDGIEWGGDIHVPHGDIETAKAVYQLTTDAGLDIPSYGSYYRIGESEDEGLQFSSVLDSAIALRTPVIRVWAGNKGSENADAVYRQAIIDESRRIASLAEQQGIKIAYEFHGGTLTDTNQSTGKLLEDVNHSNIYSYWQPPINYSLNDCQQGLTKYVANKLCHIHVFQWTKNGDELVRQPLSEGIQEWTSYLTLAESVPGTHYAMLEFVENNDPDCFIRDAASLKHIIASLS